MSLHDLIILNEKCEELETELSTKTVLINTLQKKLEAEIDDNRVLKKQNEIMKSALEEITTTCDVMDARNEAKDALKQAGDVV